ncbi:aspartyl protease family protein [Sphingomonas sp. A2-49]|uniref:aspartyl protease family protein n=1 Tax=Sphingomonas sp. A2-49 TaxID=1391375 RepID=UPI0021D2EA2F|nr:aspartyl protease family protein [Sphingomonas sp. A2-49]MCU6454578.1 aspartyl protease family protein [Sphingomonas sp. A2-49]
MKTINALALGIGALLVPTAASAKCDVAQLVELKVTMIGEKPMVDIGINGQTRRFVADSGAFFSTISPGSARELGLSLSSLPAGFQIRGIGGGADASLATVREVTLAGVPLRNIPFIVGGSEVGPGTGLLGQNVLGLGDVEYDLEHAAIRLMRPKGCGDANLAYWSGTRPVSVIPVEPRDAHQPHTIGTILLNGKKIRAVFDTGAGTTVLSLSAAARAGVTPDTPGVTAAGYSRGLGHRVVRTWLAPFDDMTIGGEQIRRTRLLIGDLGVPGVDMLIGADFFLSHRIYVSNTAHKMFFTYDGGPVFNITPSHAVDATGATLALPVDDAGPTDAAGLARRGMAFAARHQLKEADADLSRAIALAPAEGHAYYQRATVRLQERQAGSAHDDLDTAIRLAPEDAEARILRARMRLAVHDRPSATEDIDVADRVLPAASDLRLELGSLLGEIDAFDRAIAQFDGWIHAHPDDSRRPVAQNDRAWVRALGNRELPAALSDVDAAIRQRRDNANFLDTRGLVHLRLGQYDKAVADYTACLAAQPRSAWSLYGRGLAERHLGQTAAAEADVAAALKIAVHIDERFRALGIA